MKCHDAYWNNTVTRITHFSSLSWYADRLLVKALLNCLDEFSVDVKISIVFGPESGVWYHRIVGHKTVPDDYLLNKHFPSLLNQTITKNVANMTLANDIDDYANLMKSDQYKKYISQTIVLSASEYYALDRNFIPHGAVVVILPRNLEFYANHVNGSSAYESFNAALNLLKPHKVNLSINFCPRSIISFTPNCSTHLQHSENITFSKKVVYLLLLKNCIEFSERPHPCSNIRRNLKLI
jgi:hypothetical protein